MEVLNLPDSGPDTSTEAMDHDYVNPFVHYVHLSFCQKVKMVLLGLVLVPVRAVLSSICFLLLWPFCLLRIWGLSPEQMSSPITGWRRSFTHMAVKILCRILFFFLGFIRIKVKGQRASSAEAPILVAAPHSSFMDAVVEIPCDLASVMSRSENLSIPVLGALLRFSQSIMVSRQDPESRRKGVEELKRRVCSAGRWSQILIFPEGTTTNGKSLIKFKPGAFITGVPIQPVLIRYTNKLDTVRWTWKGINCLQVLLYTLSQFYTNVEIEFLPVYYPDEDEKANPVLFASNVQRLMGKSLGVPATEFEFESKRPVFCIGKLKLPLEPKVRELESVLQFSSQGQHNLQMNLEELIEKCHKGVGPWLRMEQFSSLVNTLPENVIQQIFSIFGKGPEEHLDLRAFVVCLAITDRRWAVDEVLELAFKLFDGGRKGYLSEDEFVSFLQSLLICPDLHSTEIFQETYKKQQSRLTLEEVKELFKSQQYRRLFTCYLRPLSTMPEKSSSSLKHMTALESDGSQTVKAVSSRGESSGGVSADKKGH
ncbi:lysophospholipid acyltransferase LPCAT4 isoform X1 [Erpetoichthys calabaricus]|uniref:lysophospholipid acyltransferase LPCAT4 isoform X1 n=2 Tax=Erpetoichthys calabaricus TaxID=27687 RepID=UPI0022348C99|nr:lysophospholipid acyltransferase LPCAT4 isoform X1 [Erpetoichthys calabaricus]